MPRSFQKEFDPTRGDLIYGRTDARGEYTKNLTTTQQSAIDGGAWVRIDDYNNASVLGATQNNAARDELLDKSLEFARDADTWAETPGNVEEYTTALFASNKYSPVGAYGASARKLDHERTLTTAEAQEYLVIRRACKLGIEWVVTRAGVSSTIHFVLDMIDMLDVLNKATFPAPGRVGNAVPITTSELRSIYRNWERPGFSTRIIFYLNKTECQAPWVSDAVGWGGYGLARYNKALDAFDTAVREYSARNKAARPLMTQFEKANTAASKVWLQKKNARLYNEAVALIRTRINAIDPALLQRLKDA